MEAEYQLALKMALKCKPDGSPIYQGVRDSCPGLAGPIGYIPCPVRGYQSFVNKEDRRQPDESRGEYDPCQGRGWVPTLDLNKWIEAVRDAHKGLSLFSMRDERENKWLGWRAEAGDYDGPDEVTPLLAVLKAADACV